MSAFSRRCGFGLNDLKHDAGLIDDHTHRTVAEHLKSGVRILAEVQALSTVAEPERRRRLKLLQRAAQESNTSTMVGEDELKWKMATGIHMSGTLVRQLAVAVPREVAHAVGRFRGHYDNKIAHPVCLEQQSTSSIESVQVAVKISAH